MLITASCPVQGGTDPRGEQVEPGSCIRMTELGVWPRTGRWGYASFGAPGRAGPSPLRARGRTQSTGS